MPRDVPRSGTALVTVVLNGSASTFEDGGWPWGLAIEMTAGIQLADRHRWHENLESELGKRNAGEGGVLGSYKEGNPGTAAHITPIVGRAGVGLSRTFCAQCGKGALVPFCSVTTSSLIVRQSSGW